MRASFTLESIQGQFIPFQNGIPVPSFDPQERHRIDLQGEWLKRRFSANHELSMAERGERWLAEVEKEEGSYLYGTDRDVWRPHPVPSPENRLTGKARAGAAETYEDGVWYRRSFVVEDKPDNTVYTLKALGISYVADIWLNGEWIGGHEGGFTPFAFDATSQLRAGENDIRVRVDNPPWGSRDDTIPAVAGTDFFNYTGIIQEIYIERTSSVHIARTDVVPKDADGRLTVRVIVENRGSVDRRIELRGMLFEADRNGPLFLASPYASRIKGEQARTDRPLAGEWTIPAGQTRGIVFETRVTDPKSWSMHDPNLYVAEFGIRLSGSEEESDRFSTQFGIRTVETRGTSLLLNGGPMFLAGIARHEEWPEYGRTASWERIRGDLETIRSLHANMVRTGHYPNHIFTYILLDRLGLAAMSEIPLWQFETVHYEAQERRGLADQMWREMVFSQYNRPSVLLWSTQNESKDVLLRLKHNERLVNDLRVHYDDGRLITQSAAADQPGPEDLSMEPLDVAGWTMYFGIFHGGAYYEGTRKFLEEANRAFPDKPILNTEFGHWTGDGDREERKQLETYRDTLRALMEKATVTEDGGMNPEGCVAGIDFWIMYDWYVNHNRWIDTFGIFHMDRHRPKPIAEEIRRDYGRLTGRSLGVET